MSRNIVHIKAPVGSGSSSGDGRKVAVERRYKPVVHADEIGLTSDKYLPLNASSDALPLSLSFGAMSLQVRNDWYLCDVTFYIVIL